MTTEKRWADLTPEERREERFKRWLSPEGVNFKSPETERAYKQRTMRFIKAIKLEVPDRVPVMLPVSFLPAYYAGSNLKNVMYDYEELKRVWLKFLDEFEGDSFSGPGLVLPARVLEMIDHKLHLWPGKGLPDDTSSYQYVEGEYMFPEEYDAFIQNPSDFIQRTYLPRIVGAFGGFRKLSPLTPFVGIPVFYIQQYADPDVRASVQTLLDAAQEALKWGTAVNAVSQAGMEAGYPGIWGGMSGAPFDLIGDVMRGTKGIMTDMYRSPAVLLEAMERLAPIVVEGAVRAAATAKSPIIMMPLHKGTGAFMSQKQFDTFYWPTFKKVMLGLIEEGLVPMPFAEGDYNPRLEAIQDMPPGKVVWYFEIVDMARAKRVLGGNACIAGNLPISVLYMGTPQEVKAGCRKLIETCAPGGGYILAGSASLDTGNMDNIKAMMEAAKEYGVYVQMPGQRATAP